MYFAYIFLHHEFVARDIINLYNSKNVFWHEKVAFATGLMAFWQMYLVSPLTIYGFYHGALMYIFYTMGIGVAAALIFNVNHLVEGVVYIPDRIRRNLDIGVEQIITSHNFSINGLWGMIANYLTCGLNFQIEHHLFPTFSFVNYPKIAKLTQGMCNVYKVPYHVSKTFYEAQKKHFRLMKSLGQQ